MSRKGPRDAIMTLAVSARGDRDILDTFLILSLEHRFGDEASCHRAKLFFRKDIRPELNPIQNLWWKLIKLNHDKLNPVTLICYRSARKMEAAR